MKKSGIIFKTRPPYYLILVFCYFFGSMSWLVADIVTDGNLICKIIAPLIVIYTLLAKFLVWVTVKINSIDIVKSFNLIKPRIVYTDIDIKEAIYKYAGNRSPPIMTFKFITQKRDISKKTIYLSGLSFDKIDEICDELEKKGVKVIIK